MPAVKLTRIAALTIAPALFLSGCATTRVPKNAPPIVQAAVDLKIARNITLPSQDRAGFYLDAAALASTDLGDARTGKKAQLIYNAAAAELTDLLRETDEGRLWNRPVTLGANGRSYQLTFRPGERNGAWKPDYFTDFKPAVEIRRKHIRRNVIEPGLGGTLVGIRKTPGFGPDRRAPFETKSGFVAPVTATIDFQGSNAALTLNDPAERSSTKLRGNSQPLAADFTAPIALHPMQNELVLGLLSLINGEKYLSSTGLYMLHPYDPDRIPVILVHGLASTPQMWVNVINEVEADPQLRGRFQFWVFRYPTGNPVLYSAERCREELEKVVKLHGAPRGFVMIGHSMGGLVAQMQVIEPGRAIWDRTFREKANALDARLPANHLVKKAMLFHANPNVKRVVFVCVPHRGSELALGSIGALAIKLIRLPASLATTLQDALGDVLQTVSGKTILPTSINSLSPKSPTLLAIDNLPILAPHHSIIGDRGKGNTPNSTDGVVPYWSSHLDSAESELIVPGPHGSYELPQTIDELVRILHEHTEKVPGVRQPAARSKR